MSSNQSAQAYVADSRNEDVLVYVDGALVPRNKAVVSVFDSGFVLGDGVWEGLRLVEGKIIQLEAHLDRLFEGAGSIALNIGRSRSEIREAIDQTLGANGMKDGVHIRLMVTRGMKSTPNQDPRFVIGKATLAIVAEYKAPKPEAKAKGLTLFTSTFRTSGPDVFDLRLNSHSRLNLIQALIQAIHAGADEALMLDPRGFVASCNSTNFFIIRGHELWTSTGSFSFKGLTQKAVIDSWRAGGGVVLEKDFTLAEVYSANEAFVTGTLGGVSPVVQVDGRTIGNGTPGPVTTEVSNAYHKWVVG
ncbi:MAG: aminotransferase class IV [Hoeflea sp.]|uniref:aminotransferase class IV n=1 Tax=Hoeflea sp. TaxID=1940281 RepID=UPI0032EDC023